MISMPIRTGLQSEQYASGFSNLFYDANPRRGEGLGLDIDMKARSRAWGGYILRKPAGRTVVTVRLPSAEFGFAEGTMNATKIIPDGGTKKRFFLSRPPARSNPLRARTSIGTS